MPTPSGPVKSSLGDHRLAAIVFTDVSGFSALVEKNEKHTLLLVQRDLKLISQVCQKFGGDVLKNTGDGCLAAFPSVEAAVGSAIRIQRSIADARQRLPAEDVLHHRIGIHLGDVFFNKADVLGNGVNIAARLLGEAEPDGICISQTVYDLVKHRLDVKAICIGARELKNIQEAVQVYRLLLDAVAGEQGQALVAKSPARGRWIVAAVALLILGTLGFTAWLVARSGKRSEPQAAGALPSIASTQPVASQNPATLPAASVPTAVATLPLQPDYALDSNASWHAFPVFSADPFSTSVKDDSYQITVHSPKDRVCAAISPWGAFEDVTIQADARIGGPPASMWGLQLVPNPQPSTGNQGYQKRMRVAITADGVVKVDLTRLTGSDPANRPLDPYNIYVFRDQSIPGGGPNAMLLDVRDHKLSVRVNGHPVGTTWDITPLGPATLMLIVEGNQGVVASFKELKVWLPHSAGDKQTGTAAPVGTGSQ